MATGKEFEKRCQGLAELMAWAIFLLLGAIVFDAMWEAIIKRLVGRGGGDFDATVHAVGRELIMSLPAICLLGAMWSAEQVFSRMGRGDVFAAANAGGIAECGRWFQGAAIAAVIATPSLLGWINFEHGVRVDFDWTFVVLFLLGVGLTLIGDVFVDAVAARTELNEIV